MTPFPAKVSMVRLTLSWRFSTSLAISLLDVVRGSAPLARLFVVVIVREGTAWRGQSRGVANDNPLGKLRANR